MKKKLLWGLLCTTCLVSCTKEVAKRPASENLVQTVFSEANSPMANYQEPSYKINVMGNGLSPQEFTAISNNWEQQGIGRLNGNPTLDKLQDEQSPRLPAKAFVTLLEKERATAKPIQIEHLTQLAILKYNLHKSTDAPTQQLVVEYLDKFMSGSTVHPDILYTALAGTNLPVSPEQKTKWVNKQLELTKKQLSSTAEELTKAQQAYTKLTKEGYYETHPADLDKHTLAFLTNLQKHLAHHQHKLQELMP